VEVKDESETLKEGSDEEEEEEEEEEWRWGKLRGREKGRGRVSVDVNEDVDEDADELEDELENDGGGGGKTSGAIIANGLEIPISFSLDVLLVVVSFDLNSISHVSTVSNVEVGDRSEPECNPE